MSPPRRVCPVSIYSERNYFPNQLQSPCLLAVTFSVDFYFSLVSKGKAFHNVNLLQNRKLFLSLFYSNGLFKYFKSISVTFVEM